MQTILLVIHVIICFSLVSVILIQRTESGAGLMGGGTMGGLFTARGTASGITKVTYGLATAFIITSLLLAVLATRSDQAKSVLDQAPAATDIPAEQQPEVPAPPSVPVAK